MGAEHLLFLYGPNQRLTLDLFLEEQNILTFLTPKPAPAKFILERVFKEGKEGRDLNAGR